LPPLADPENDPVRIGGTSQPGFCTFEPSTSTFTCNPGIGDAGTYTAEVVFDDTFQKVSNTFYITVNPIANTPPTFDVLPLAD
jgi:hypothetical protein